MCHRDGVTPSGASPCMMYEDGNMHDVDDDELFPMKA